MRRVAVAQQIERSERRRDESRERSRRRADRDRHLDGVARERAVGRVRDDRHLRDDGQTYEHTTNPFRPEVARLCSAVAALPARRAPPEPRCRAAARPVAGPIHRLVWAPAPVETGWDSTAPT